MLFRAIFCLALALSALVCLYALTEGPRIDIGMTAQEIEEILGKPVATADAQSIRVWEVGSRTIRVFFVDERVVSVEISGDKTIWERCAEVFGRLGGTQRQ
jgi:hypothetical protein